MGEMGRSFFFFFSFFYFAVEQKIVLCWVYPVDIVMLQSIMAGWHLRFSRNQTRLNRSRCCLLAEQSALRKSGILYSWSRFHCIERLKGVYTIPFLRSIVHRLMALLSLARKYFMENVNDDDRMLSLPDYKHITHFLRQKIHSVSKHPCRAASEQKKKILIKTAPLPAMNFKYIAWTQNDFTQSFILAFKIHFILLFFWCRPCEGRWINLKTH